MEIGNPPALFVGLKTGTFAFKITVENSQKLKINLPCDPVIPVPGKCPEAGTLTSQILAQSC